MPTINELYEKAVNLAAQDDELKVFVTCQDSFKSMPLEDVFLSIRRRLLAVPHKANDCIADHVSEADLAVMELRAAVYYQEVLESLLIDTTNDPNSCDTAARVAKMLLHEQFKGRYTKMPEVSSFPNTGENALDGLYVVGPLAVKSACSHHHVPIEGEAWVAVFPGDRVIGLSKFSRVLNWVMRRPQIQEEATRQAAKIFMQITGAKGIGIVVKAKHHCMCHRGVEEPNSFHTTSDMLGSMRENPALKQEFLSLIKL